MKKNKQSKLLDKGREKDTKGRRGYDPSQIYMYLYANIDRYGVIAHTQKEMAEAIQMSKESMGNFYQDFLALGLIEKVSNREFKVLVKPDEINWDEIYEDFLKLRKRHQPAAYGKQEENNEGE